MIGIDINNFRIKSERLKIKKFAKSILKSEKFINTDIWTHLNKNGEVMYMDIHSHKIKYKGRNAILALGLNVTEIYEQKEELTKANKNIRKLHANLESIRDEERLKLSRDLHDVLGQQMTLTKLYSSILLESLNNQNIEKERDYIMKIADNTDQSIGIVREIASQLRKSLLNDLTLAEAIQLQCEQARESSGIQFEVNKNDDFLSYEFNQLFILEVYRIFQEGLTNIIRHSNASNVIVELTIKNDVFKMVIEDNGIGYTESTKRKNSIGLIGMDERANVLNGNLIITSEVGKGTKIELTVNMKNIDFEI
jgi:signal transduction histidine kinase